MKSPVYSPRRIRGSVNILVYSPPLRWIIAHYSPPLQGIIVKYRETCMCARVQKRRENEVTRAPNCSQSQSRMNEPVFCRYGNNATNFNKSNKIERFLCEWRKIKTIKVGRNQSYNKHLIRRLTSQYDCLFLLVELYFGSPKGSPKYCRLVKILAQSYWLVNRLIRYIYIALRSALKSLILCKLGRLWPTKRPTMTRYHPFQTWPDLSTQPLSLLSTSPWTKISSFGTTSSYAASLINMFQWMGSPWRMLGKIFRCLLRTRISYVESVVNLFTATSRRC